MKLGDKLLLRGFSKAMYECLMSMRTPIANFLTETWNTDIINI